MKRYLTGSVLVALVALSGQGYAFQGPPPGSQPPKRVNKTAAPVQTFVGVISDGQCATKGSHKEIMKKASVNSAANCAKGCARRYGYVLFVPSTKQIYKLSDQERPAELVAKRVRIKGALDKATETIFVSSIEPVL